MTTQLATATKVPAITKPAMYPAPASGKASLALFPAEREGAPPTLAICRFTSAGTLRAVNVPMKISAAKGETFALKTKVGDQWVEQHSLTAVAYDRLNTVAGVSFFTHPERLVDNEGKPRPNPWIEQDANGAIHFVRVALVGLGRSATGNLVGHALSVTYDLRTYLAQDLWSKWQGKKGYDGGRGGQAKAAVASKDWGVITPPDATSSGSPKHTIPFYIPAGIKLWCDYSHPEVQAIIGEHINRQKFAERNSITICRRNILKKFLGVSRLGADMTVNVTGYVSEDRDLVRMSQAVAASQSGEIVVDAEQINVVREDMGVVSEDEVDASLAGEADQDGWIPAGSEPPDEFVDDTGTAPSAPAPATEDPAKAEARAKIRKIVEALGDAAWNVLGGMGYETMNEVAALQSIDTLKEIVAALEKAQPGATQAKAATKGTAKAGDKLFSEPKKPQGPV